MAQEETQALPEPGLSHLVLRAPEGDEFCKGSADNWVQCRYPESEGLNPCPQAEPVLTEGGGAMGQRRATTQQGLPVTSAISFTLG